MSEKRYSAFLKALAMLESSNPLQRVTSSWPSVDVIRSPIVNENDLHGTVLLQMWGFDMPVTQILIQAARQHVVKNYRPTAYMYIKYYIGLIVPMIRVPVTPIMNLRLILWHKETSKKVSISKFGFDIYFSNIWFDTKIIQIRQIFAMLLISVYSMANILKNGHDLKFLDG